MPSPLDSISASQAQRPLFCGVDVGGTNIKIGLVDDLGRPLRKTSIRTEEQRGPEDAVARMHQVIVGLLREIEVPLESVAGVGLGTPGTMDIPNGLILEPVNLPHWRHFPLRDRLSQVCGKPVVFTNDANAAAYGEFWIGSGKEHHSLVLLTLGTGVGGGIVLKDTLLEGVNSFGAECGHIIINGSETARLCTWGGGRGQLEAYASASAVVERTLEVLATGRASSLRARIEHGEPLTTLMIYEEAERGDSLAWEIIQQTAKFLGIGIVTLVHTLDPGLVVLGGAMNFGGDETEIGRRFLDEVRREFRRRSFDVVAENTVIRFATLGGDSGYIGAAGLARAAYHRKK